MKSAKILVVEDESIVAKDLQKRLRKCGYNVPFLASSGEEAINKAAGICPDLVLIDIRLKGDMDGIEAARQIYNRFKIPVIYITAYEDDSKLERVKLTEPFGYLLKPFKERELCTTIEIALNKDKLEKQLKENQQLLATVINCIDDGVIASNAQEVVTFMNPVAEKLTGWKQEEACGKKASEVFKIINAKTRKVIENPLTKLFQDGVIVCLESDTILICRNGAEIPIDDRAAPIKDDKDNIIGAVLVFRDITERQWASEVRQKQIEQEQLVAQLEQVNRLKDDFLNTVSHELRTPLSNIMMAIQILQSTGTNEQGQRYLELLQTECDRELELINYLLDLQRLEAAITPFLTPEPLLLQYWLTSIVESFFIRTQERQQTLQLNLPSDIPPLYSDSTHLARIFAELLNNACKYTPAGGEIILSVRYEGSGQWARSMGQWAIEEKTHQIGRNNKLAVPIAPCPMPIAPCPPASTIFTISNSTEIPATALPRIFEKFYRVNHADVWQQSGTGLGLALIQKLVEQLQGTIQVESSAGWTTFTLMFTDLTVAT